jgi:uncharacterized BrkB/YihY/UPF0761 family membrane protein
MSAIFNLLKRRAIGWLAAILVGALASVGLVGPDVEQAVGTFLGALFTFLLFIVSEVVSTILQQRQRDAGEVVPELLESNRVSSLRK